MRHLLLFIIVTANIAFAEPHDQPTPSQSEVALSRWAQDHSEILWREFDLPGSRANFLWATSVAGSPDLYIPRLGIYEPVARLPEQAAGLYSSRLRWDAWGLGLNGENGILRDHSGLSASIDTPVILLDWQRSAFTGNSLRMDFQRSLVDSVFFDLGLTTHSTDSSGMFRYQDITHQPYLGTLKRDSTRVPLSGRNLAFDSFIMHPRIVWQTANFSLGATALMFRLDNDDATRQVITEDSLDHWKLKFNEPPFNVKTRASGIGIEASLHPSNAWRIDWWHQMNSISNQWTKVPTRFLEDTARIIHIAADTIAGVQQQAAHDTTVYDSLTTASSYVENSDEHTGQLRAILPWTHTVLALQYESRIFTEWRDESNHDRQDQLWEDRELVHAIQSDSIHLPTFMLYGTVDAGVQRNSNTWNKTELDPAYSIESHADFGSKIRVEGALKVVHTFADAEKNRFASSGRLTLPNADLLTEERRSGDLNVTYHTPAFSYGLGLRRESILNPIRLGWMLHPYENTLPDTVAFRYENLDSIGNLAWRWFGGFHLGNWDFWFTREASLHRTLTTKDGTYVENVPDSPIHTYKGSVEWSKLIVNQKLQLNIRWDFEWIADQQDFAIDTYNNAQRISLPSSLLLGFEARMTIKSFQIYTRMDNLNHTKLTPEAGYAPPGVVFRYGILWELGG